MSERILEFERKRFMLNRAQAEGRLEKEGYITLSEIIARAKTKVDWPESAWDELEEWESGSLREERRVRRRHVVAAVACLLVLAIGAAMLLAPVRQAVAEWIREYIILVHKNDMIIFPPADENKTQAADPSSNGVIDVPSIEEFTEITGYKPLVLDLPAFTLELESIEAVIHYDTTFSAGYSCSDGMVYVTQIWDLTTEMYGFTNSEFNEYITESGQTVYWAVDNIDNVRSGIWAADDSVVMVGAEGSMPMERFFDIIDYLTAPQA